MEELKTIIRKLSDEEYNWLLTEISDNKMSKPYMVLEQLRINNCSDNEMMQHLNVNPSTFYTLKSRLRTKVATVLSKKVENPISTLRDEVSRVSAFLYGNNKSIAVRALKDLEKNLINYDLSNELIHVYKSLAYLHRYEDDFAHYQNLYNKHVAFSLAVDKAENLFYQFLKNMGDYLLNYNEETLEAVKLTRRELENVCELYDSHRMFVLNNIVRIYDLCLEPGVEAIRLQEKELEFEAILNEINKIFDNYPLDTFYQNIKFIGNLLFFIYYQRINHVVRAEFYYNKINPVLPELAEKHINAFHVMQALNAKLLLANAKNDYKYIYENLEELENELTVDPREIYHYVSFQKYRAVCKLYTNDFSQAARLLNELRNKINLKQSLYADVDTKLFQGLLYALMGEDNLCLQLINSVKRQVKENEKDWPQVKLWTKYITVSMKDGKAAQKEDKLNKVWDEVKKTEQDVPDFLGYVTNGSELSKLLSVV